MNSQRQQDVRMQGFQTRISVAQFEGLIDEHVCLTQKTHILPIEETRGRVLAETLHAKADVPPFDRSAMDGYALQAQDTQGADRYNSLSLKVLGRAFAGQACDAVVTTGTAVQIMTGAPIPTGADAVLMAEDTEASEDWVQVKAVVTPRRHVGMTGEDVKKGEVLFQPGRVLRPQDIGVLAAVGHTQVQVSEKPRVDMLITGNELVAVGEEVTHPKIVDSNSVMLSALLERDGAIVNHIHRLPDDKALIKKALLQSQADVILVSGGTSVGVEDYAPALLQQCGELLCHGVAMRPSAPSGFGRIDNRLVFLLPGNPVSCLAAYDFFARRAICAMQGVPLRWPYRQASYLLGERLVSAIGRVDYARLVIRENKMYPLAVSGASLLTTTTRSDGFIVVPEDSEGVPAGEMLSIWLYD